MDTKIILIIMHSIIILLSIKLILNKKENLINLRYDHKEEVGKCCKCKNKDNCIHKPFYLTFDCDENIQLARDTLSAFYKLMYTNEEYNRIREKIDNETVENIEKRFEKMIRFRKSEEEKRAKQFQDKLDKDAEITRRVLENMEAVGLDKFLSTITISKEEKDELRKEVEEYATIRDLIDIGSVIPESAKDDYEDSQTNFENPKVHLDEDDYN
jgi:hypothetical protein